MRGLVHSVVFRASLLGLATVSAITCTGGSPLTGTTEQAAVTQLPSNLNLALYAKSSLTIGGLSQITGDVGGSGLTGSVVFDVSSTQNPANNVVANTVTISAGASVGHIYGNDITLNGNAAQESIGVDPRQLPPVPTVTASTPGTTNVSTGQNQAKQLCPGQYGTISLGLNSVLNLNGGVYQIQKLVLADGARLEPSEPVVILVAGALTTNVGSIIRPSAQALNPMSAADIRIEVGGAITLGDSNQIRAHLLGAAKVTTGQRLNLTGALWAKTITIGSTAMVISEGAFAAQPPTVPPPCNDNNACTTDACVNLGATGFCTSTPAPSGTSCEDGKVCNGAETCDGNGACQPGSPATAGTSCTDGNVCNGAEACDGGGGCAAGTPPTVDDGNACTADSCDPIGGVIHTNLPDGTKCSGSGICQNGTCSVQGTVFTDNFIQFQDSQATCDHWNDFLFNQLNNGSYTSISMSSSVNPTGVTCSEPAAATQICNALHNNGSAAVSCDGHLWFVGFCDGVELNVDIGVCFCSESPTVRPCTFFGGDWGGIGTETCGGQSQSMTVVCQ